MKPADEDLDALLRQAFDGPVPDAGFSDRLMQRLPPRRNGSAWPLAAGILGGIIACWLSLDEAPLWRLAWRDLLVGRLSTATVIVVVAMAGMSLLALVWTLAEVEDH